MRPSKKTEILDAAARLVQREGVAAVTYDSIAAESGITKGGLNYHFPTREELITALHEHLAAQWESGMSSVTGRSADQLTAAQRLDSYVRAAASSATRAELLFLLEGSTTAEHATAWREVMERWTPPVPDDATDTVVAEQFIAQLAADGLWMYEALSDTPLDPTFRRRIADLIAARILGTDN